MPSAAARRRAWSRLDAISVVSDVVGISGVAGPNRNDPQVELEVCSL